MYGNDFSDCITGASILWKVPIIEEFVRKRGDNFNAVIKKRFDSLTTCVAQDGLIHSIVTFCLSNHLNVELSILPAHMTNTLALPTVNADLTLSRKRVVCSEPSLHEFHV